MTHVRSFFPVVISGILAAVIVAAVYWPARDNGFVWDDRQPLVHTPVLRDPASWREAMLTAPLKDPAATRPIAMLSFMLQLWAGQTEPAPFHVVNIILHAVNVLLLVLFAGHVLGGTTSTWKAALAAALSGLIYGLHPALTESVLWISCRYDLLLTFFLLLALLFDRGLPAAGWTRALLVSAAFIAAVLSKETAVGFLLALPFVHLALDSTRGGSPARAAPAAALAGSFRVYVALLVASLLYLVARFVLHGATLGMQSMVFQFGDVPTSGQRVLAAVASLSHLVADALWPFKGIVPSRALELPIDIRNVAPVLAVGASAIVAAVLAACTIAGARLPALLFAAFIASLLPVINLVPLPGRWGQIWVASRYLTFPLVIICLGAPFVFRVVEARLAKVIVRPRPLLSAVAAVWIAASMANVRVTIPLWKDEPTLGAWAIQQGAREYWRYQNLGEYYLRAGAPHEARDFLAAAVKARSGVGNNWYLLGLAEALLENPAEAAHAFHRALELDQNIIGARVNIAKLELKANNPQAAATVLEAGLGRLTDADDPNQIGVLHFLLGGAYAKLGRTDDAVTQLKSALARAQNSQERAAAEKALASVTRPVDATDQ